MMGKQKEIWSHTHTHTLMRDMLERVRQNRAGQVQTINHCMESQITRLCVCLCVYDSCCGDIYLFTHCGNPSSFQRPNKIPAI